MKRILVDFNVGQDKNGLMRLNTRGSIRTLKDTGAVAGETVLLDDGDDCSVIAKLVEKDDGKIYGQFDWDNIKVDDR